MVIITKVDKWPNGDGPVLLVRKLRSTPSSLTSKEIAAVLEAIETTCSYCWDSEKPCNCKGEE